MVVIGAGWAGFNAAIRAKELGLKAVLIEKDKIGGTCLNRGCIPTKALIQSAKVFSLLKKSSNFGVRADNLQINFSEVRLRKEKIVSSLSKGIEFMLKGIDIIPGEAKVISGNCVEVSGMKIETKSVLIASGSRPIELKSFKFDGKKILSSDDILELEEIPVSLLIIGGGVIGCEFASLFSNLGTQVTLVEKLPQLLPGEDSEVARKLEQIFKKKGIKVNTNTDATTLNLADYSQVLVCVGRVPVEKIEVDGFLRTKDAGVFAAGDCTGKIQLAHYAAYQGKIAAENIANPQNLKKCDNANIPSCIFTDPEIASVGQKEGQVHRFDFLGSGMARILDEAEGFIKIISEESSGRVIGASIIGPKATELISVLTLAVSGALTVSQLKNTVFAHPTLSESIHDCL